VRLTCAVSHCDNLNYHGLTAQCNLFWLHPWMGMSVPFVWLTCAVSHCDNLDYHGLTAQCNLFWLHPWMGMSVPFVWLTCAVSHCDNLSYHGLTTQCNLFWLHPRMGMSVLEVVCFERKKREISFRFLERKKFSEKFFCVSHLCSFPIVIHVITGLRAQCYPPGGGTPLDGDERTRFGKIVRESGEKWQNPYDLAIWFDKKNFLLKKECCISLFCKEEKGKPRLLFPSLSPPPPFLAMHVCYLRNILITYAILIAFSLFATKILTKIHFFR